jgi:hypothetical protein
VRGSRLLWLAGAFGTAAFALLGVGTNFASSRQNYDLWGSGWLVAAYLLATVAIGAFAVSFEGVRRLRPVRKLAPISSELNATIEFFRSHLLVKVVNDGATLRDAGVTVLIPHRLSGPYWPHRNDAHSTFGIAENETPESLSDDGESSHQWHSKGFHILGGGHLTELYWRVNGPPGDYPARLRIYDDEVRPRALVKDGAFTIPPREIDPDSRKRMLDVMSDELSSNRHRITTAIARGCFEAPREDQDGLLQVRWAGQARGPGLDYDGSDAKLSSILVIAYDECKRVTERVDASDASQLTTEASDHLEKCLVSVLHALIHLDAAREDAKT